MTDTAIEQPYKLLDDPNRLRSVTFIDANSDAPLHVAAKILFNGEKAQIRVPSGFDWAITGCGLQRETRVSLVVHPDDVTWGKRAADGTMEVQWTVGGLPVLVPVGDEGESLWERIDAEPQEPVYGLLKDGRVSGYPSGRRVEDGEVVYDETDHWVRVVMQVDEATAVHG